MRHMPRVSQKHAAGFRELDGFYFLAVFMYRSRRKEDQFEARRFGGLFTQLFADSKARRGSFIAPITTRRPFESVTRDSSVVTHY